MLGLFKKSTKKSARRPRKPSAGIQTRADAGRARPARDKYGAASKSTSASKAKASVRTQRAPAAASTSASIRRTRKASRRVVAWYWRRRLWAAGLSMAGMAVIVLTVFLIYIASSLPDITSLTKAKTAHGIRIETADGALIAAYGEAYGETIPYNQMPRHLIDAVLATEDRRFFEHGGVDVWGIIRAAVVNARAGRVVQGGSTITQQLAKNLFLTPERTLKRKLQEVLLAFSLERRYSKQELLAAYLNRVYLGAGTYGVDAASRRYFGVGARQMQLQESAMLAGLLKAPSRYAPTANAARARNRTRQVLINMVAAEKITPPLAKQAAIALNAPRRGSVAEGSGSRYFADWVVETLPDVIGAVDDDIVVTTTLNVSEQAKAEDALVNIMASEGPAKRIRQGALVSMLPDGAIQAMVGGINYNSSQYNRAAQARRQAGSTFKLFVYLAALEAGYSPQSRVMDAPLQLTVNRKPWNPTNFTGKYAGEVSLAYAARESLNTAAVRISQAVGLYRVASMARRLGIARVPTHPSLALGAVDVTLLELTGAYAHLAAQGASIKPYGIRRITTTGGKLLYQRPEVTPSQVLDKDVVAMMNYLLRGAVAQGTATRAAIDGRDVAGKTGTSQDFKDAWFVGYTSQRIAGVWVGNDDNQPMLKVTGGNVPAMVWRSFMQAALGQEPAIALPMKEGASPGIFPWQANNLPDAYGAEAAAMGLEVTGAASDQQQPRPFAHQPPQQDVPFSRAAPINSDATPLSPMQPRPVKTNAAGKTPVTREKATNNPLDEAFWDTLLDEAATQKIEYDYPDKR